MSVRVGFYNDLPSKVQFICESTFFVTRKMSFLTVTQLKTQAGCYFHLNIVLC